MSSLAELLAPLHARAPDGADTDFLARLYASTRPDLHSLTADPAFVSSLIAMQQRLQTAAYLHAYPTANYLVLEYQGQCAGRIVVNESAADLRLVDIAVLPALRGQGVGSQILGALQRYCRERGLSLTLSVHHTNPDARRLYRRLGFEIESCSALSDQLVWNNAVRVMAHS
ncbi:MAG: GNAT family N-acetyltransferase [Massilia sp.]